jgi:hypothetical protein
MSAKSSTATACVALILALGLLGYAAWATWTLRNSLSRLAQAQERSLREMAISLAHTEGQMGRVQEAMKAFDLQQWLATVQGPLVGQLEAKMLEVQRQVVRDEVGRSAHEIKAEQNEGLQRVSHWMDEIKSEMSRQDEAVKRLGESVMLLVHNNETQFKKYEETIGAEFSVLRERNKEIKEQLSKSGEPSAELRADLEGIEKENRELREWLEQWSAAAEEFRAQVTERFEQFADAAAKQNAKAEEEIDESAKRWQGLFLTLQENHEAELQSVRDALSRLEQQRVRALEQVESAKTTRDEPQTRRVDRPAGNRETGLRELMEFCTRLPESALCRDLKVR